MRLSPPAMRNSTDAYRRALKRWMIRMSKLDVLGCARRRAHPRTSSLDILIIHLFNALLYASVLFLIAGGLSLIYGVMRIVNLAHGNLFALGAFATASVVGQLFAGSTSWWLYLLLPAGALLAAAIGAVLEPTLLRSFY